MGKHLNCYELARLQSLRDQYPPTPYAKIAQTLKRDPSTLCRAYHRVKKRKSYHRKRGSGRKRATTTRDDRHIIYHSIRNPYDSNTKTKNRLKLKVSSRTIGRRLDEDGLHSYYQLKKPWISETNRRKRLKFAERYRRWSIIDWKHVLFSDEKKWTIRYQQKKRVRRRKGQGLNPLYIKSTIKHDTHIMVWSCFSWYGPGAIYRIKGKLEQKQYHYILQHKAIPSLKQMPGFSNYFQQDNDPKHTSKYCQKYLRNKKIKQIEWAAQSPDLNPMENAHKYLDDILENRTCKNGEELFQLLEKAWKEIDKNYLKTLVASMPRRIKAVLKANGGHTKY